MSQNINSLLAGIKKLDGTNYYDWKFDISMVLRRGGSFKVVTGLEKKPKASQKEEVEEWESLAEDGLSAIGLTIAQSQKQYIRDAKDGVEAWKALAEIYEKNSTSTRISLKRRFYGYRHSAEKPITDYINDITSLASQLRAIGIPLADQEITDVMIYALAPEYSTIATALMTRPGEKDKDGKDIGISIADVSSALLEEESRRIEAAAAEGDNTALMARDRQPVCRNCQRSGHTKENCWSKGGGKEGQRKCFKCHKQGHVAWNCPETQETTETSNIAY